MPVSDRTRFGVTFQSAVSVIASFRIVLLPSLKSIWRTTIGRGSAAVGERL